MFPQYAAVRRFSISEKGKYFSLPPTRQIHTVYYHAVDVCMYGNYTFPEKKGEEELDEEKEEEYDDEE